MPAKAEWLLRLPEILAALRVLDVPVVDRAAIQRLFGFRRRRAIQFMHALDGYQAGHCFLVDRLRLIAQLEVLQNGEGFHRESRRRMNLEETVEEARRHAVATRVKIPVEPPTWNTRLHALPGGDPAGARLFASGVPQPAGTAAKALRLVTGHGQRFRTV